MSEDLLRRLEAYIPWGRSLVGFSDAMWLAPMGPGKWSVGECVAHLYIWDRFALTHRLPRFVQDARLDAAPSSWAMNNFAANYARSGVSREGLIDQFVGTKLEVIERLRAQPETHWGISFVVGHEVSTPRAYWLEMLEHSDRHRLQIERFWRSQLSSVD